MRSFVILSVTLLPLLVAAAANDFLRPRHLQTPAAGSGANRPRNLTDEQLLDLVQRQTFRYFWDFGHPESGMARERTTSGDVVTTGGTGFGLMAIIVAAKHGWISREQAASRTLQIVNFLRKAETYRYYGVFPHWMNGTTGETLSFNSTDDANDLQETALLFEGLISALQFYTDNTTAETELRNGIQFMWERVEWTWHQQCCQNVLYWHWSPNYGWEKNTRIQGWNECLITYVLAASSPKYRYAIDKNVYDQGFATGATFLNGELYYNTSLPLGPEKGGPLFFSYFSFLGINPRGLSDSYADYWQQNQAHTMINYAHCVNNSNNCRGYGPDCWGLTSSDGPLGYNEFSPTNDSCVIAPTAALSAMPYAPVESMAALRHFYDDLGDDIWTEYGFVDAFSEQENWYATQHLAIDQGPIIVMIENYRTCLLWKLFMNNSDVQRGLSRLGFD